MVQSSSSVPSRDHLNDPVMVSETEKPYLVCGLDHDEPSSSNKDSSSASYLSLMKTNRPFRLFLISYIANHMGEWLTYMASISAIQQSQSSKMMSISFLIVLRLAPKLLVLPLGGVLADQRDRRWSMIVLDLVGASVACLFIAAAHFGSIRIIYVATFLQQCASGLYEPNRSAIVPLLTPNEEELKKATTLVGMAWSVIAALGAATGGLLVSVVGVQFCYAADCATYLLSAVLMTQVGGKWSVVQRSEENTTTDNGVGVDVGRLVCEGIEYLRGSPFGMLVFLKASVDLVSGACDILNVSLSEMGSEQRRAPRLGLLFGSVGFGCIIGPLISDYATDMARPMSLQVWNLYALLVVAFGCFMVGETSCSFGWVLVFTSIRSMGMSLLWVNSSLLLQKFSLPNMLGRVTSIEYALTLLAEASSSVAGGLLQDKGGLSAEDLSFLLGLVACALFVSWSLYTCRGGGAAGYLNGATNVDDAAVPTNESTPLL